MHGHEHPHVHGAGCCGHNHAAPATHSKASAWVAAHHATVHCLTGCVIGEVAGLMIGVSLGLSTWNTIALATCLSYISGFSLAIFPLMRRTDLRFRGALKAIWLGELISIGVMELVMNAVDYHMGGMQAASVLHWQFWKGLAFAIPAGYLAAFPVNAWLLGKQLKQCH